MWLISVSGGSSDEVDEEPPFLPSGYSQGKLLLLFDGSSSGEMNRGAAVDEPGRLWWK
jgi:hypothetical protein